MVLYQVTHKWVLLWTHLYYYNFVKVVQLNNLPNLSKS